MAAFKVLDLPEDDSELTAYSELTKSWAISALFCDELGGTEKVAEIEAALQAQD